MDKKFTVEYCKNNKVAIFVHDNEEIKTIGKLINYNGFPTDFSDIFFHQGYGVTLYEMTKGNHANLKWFVERDYEIIKSVDFIKLNAPEFEFKPGMWVKRSSGFIQKIVKWESEEEATFYNEYGILFSLKDELYTCRPATPDEISKHLEVMAMNRGFKGGVYIVRSLEILKGTDNKNCAGKVAINNGNTGFTYEFDNDTLFLNHRVIYHNNMWAEIVPNTITLQFGDTKVECDPQTHTVETKHGKFNLDQIRYVIESLNSVDICIQGRDERYTVSFPTVKIGCQIGTLEQLQAIYKATK